MSSSQCLRRTTALGSQRSALLARNLPAISNRARLACVSSRNASSALNRSCGLPSPASVRPSTYLRTSQLIVTHFRGYADQIVKVPEMAESITEGTLKQFSKQVGDYVEQDEEIATIETDKIDVAVNAPSAGTIKEFLVKEDDTVNVGQDLLKLELGGDGSGGKKEAKSEPKGPASDKQETSSQPDGGREQESSGVKKAASEATQDSKPETSQVRKGSEIKEEVSKTPQQSPSQESRSKAEPATSKSPGSSDSEGSSKPKGSSESGTPSQQPDGPFGKRDERRVKMNRMRLRISERLKQSQNTAASLTTFNEVDMSSLMEFRKLYKDEILKKTGVKLGFMSAFSRACCLAIKELPSVNASIEGAGPGDTIVYKDYVDISVAVATEKGLVTPVVRNAESMDMIGIEKEIAALGKKARDNKLTIEDMAGGTFTISNGGVFGSLMGTPIINLPQTAVLGLHAIKDKPVAINGKVEIRPMMYLALTYDHRLLDGREAVTFLVRVKEFIEDPRKMLLG